MEFLDEDTRPRFLFQSRAVPSPGTELQAYQKPGKAFIFISTSVSCLLFAFSVFFLPSEPIRSLLLWLSLSILIGPFAPISLTGGDIRVGRGAIVEFPNQEPTTDEETKKKALQKRSKTRRSEELTLSPIAVAESVNVSERGERKNRAGDGNGVLLQEETEWTEEDVEVLRKQLQKHPVGKPGRWEVIGEAFKGRHKVESVIKKAKELGEKKADDADPYAQFLKKRKPVDKRVENENENLRGGLIVKTETRKDVSGGEGPVTGWIAGEDLALLNALKAFPKDVSMRWEKIAAAVPGKSKAACVKRVAELTKEFRSTKAAADG
ncbi:hypothetical protein L6164_028006 [Bauhinia variegata]|uniref:Uncharacterized protein n=1 Tax=Bauhinia variegata TaxID=167791 RepID=A0ACB9LUW2_BAUVA|nr:hypothetical protein L6164_028006 [Bauhinia variegata]